MFLKMPKNKIGENESSYIIAVIADNFLNVCFS